uniref:Uncharacterized protein n=1 Tax=Rhizophora mucronata TaxID=61149 RepID=A0A2P2NIY4_RHIMU
MILISFSYCFVATVFSVPSYVNILQFSNILFLYFLSYFAQIYLPSSLNLAQPT